MKSSRIYGRTIYLEKQFKNFGKRLHKSVDGEDNEVAERENEDSTQILATLRWFAADYLNDDEEDCLPGLDQHILEMVELPRSDADMRKAMENTVREILIHEATKELNIETLLWLDEK